MSERVGHNEKRSNDESDDKDFLYDMIEGQRVLVARWVCEDGEYYLKYTKSKK